MDFFHLLGGAATSWMGHQRAGGTKPGGCTLSPWATIVLGFPPFSARHHQSCKCSNKGSCPLGLPRVGKRQVLRGARQSARVQLHSTDHWAHSDYYNDQVQKDLITEQLSHSSGGGGSEGVLTGTHIFIHYFSNRSVEN